MKLKNLNKARDINQLIEEYKHFLEVKRKCWGKIRITRLEVNYILDTSYGFLSKEIEVDRTLSGLITEAIQKRIEMLKQELVELGVEIKELEDE